MRKHKPSEVPSILRDAVRKAILDGLTKAEIERKHRVTVRYIDFQRATLKAEGVAVPDARRRPETADAIRKLAALGCKSDEIAKQLGVSVGYVNHRRRQKKCT